MKIYIEYTNPVEAKCNQVKILPKTKGGKVVSVAIYAQGQPEIRTGKPYEYEQEIVEMLKTISAQNKHYEVLKKDHTALEKKYNKAQKRIEELEKQLSDK